MAIEDAAALGVLLSNMTSKDDISARLDMFNQLRVKRVAATQIASSMHQWDPTRVSEEQRQYFDGDVPRKNGPPWISGPLSPCANHRCFFPVNLETIEDIEIFSYENSVIRDAFDLLERA